MNEKTKKIIAGLLQYSMEGIDWNFDHSTVAEKSIIGNQEELDIVKNWVMLQLKVEA